MGLLTDAHGRGVFASRPAAGHAGREYYSTDTSVTYRDNGSSWDAQATAGFTNPMTTAEDIIYGGASGAPTRKAKGADGTFLGVASGALGYTAVTDALLSTSDITTNNASTTKHGFAPKYPNDATKYLDGTGAYSVPPGTGGGGGALVLLGTYTASASATLDLVTRNASGQSGAIFQSDYDDYEIVMQNLLPATDQVGLQFLVSTDGGSTYLAGTNYAYYTNRSGGSQSSAGGALFPADGYNAGLAGNTASYGGVSGVIRLFNPLSATAHKMLTLLAAYRAYDGTVEAVNGSGAVLTTTALNAGRFKMSSGNITSGKALVYARSH